MFEDNSTYEEIMHSINGLEYEEGNIEYEMDEIAEDIVDNYNMGNLSRREYKELFNMLREYGYSDE